jgi:hypothetical protein
VSEDDSTERQFFDPGDEFTGANTSIIFWRLTALKHLSMSTNNPAHNDHCMSPARKTAQTLTQYYAVEWVDPCRFNTHAAPLSNVRQMILRDIQGGIAAFEAARLYDRSAPKREKVLFESITCPIRIGRYAFSVDWI